MVKRRIWRWALGVLAVGLLALAIPLGAGAHRTSPATARASARPAHPTARAARASAPVPQGFVGVDVDPPVYGNNDSPDFQDQVNQMVGAGVQSMRIAFSWAAIEPYQSWSDVPSGQTAQFTNVDGRPFNFTYTDEYVAAAAQSGITILPTMLYTPSWDAVPNRNGVATPRSDGPFGTFLTALIGRYGPHGSLWRDAPQIPFHPIRQWQIWNEENLAYYWHQPFASSYVGLLRVAHTAIKSADPGAKVVLGALTNFAWESLGKVYRVPGASRLFDVVSVNAFTKLPSDVILYLRYMRDAMDHFHDRRTPLVATELSWPSAIGQRTSQHFDFDTTEAGQAHNIATLLPLLGRDRRWLGLTGFYYDTWMGNEADRALAFNFAGLLRFMHGRITPKPAFGAFRHGALALEHCRSKGAVATSCIG